MGGTLALSVLAKFAIFLIGVAIMGVLSTRTQLPVCGSQISSSVPVYSSPIGDLEAYTDYRDLYLRCLVNPFLAGKSAYSLPIVYNYPPLFLYTLAIFALESLVWFPAIALVLFDALTVVPLYLIAKDFLFSGSKKLAFAVSLIWIFNPINLFYNDLVWLNTAPTTFFLVMSIYLILKQKWGLSAISLAVATGFKQTAVLVFPIFLVWMLRTVGFSKKILAYGALYVSILILISTPYIFQNPQQYFWALQLPILGTPPGAGSSIPSTFIYDLSQPTRLTTFLGLVSFVNLKSLAVSTYYVLNYVFATAFAIMLLQIGIGLRNLGKLIQYEIRVAAASVMWAAQRFKVPKRSVIHPEPFNYRVLTGNDLIVYCLTGMLLFMSFFGRGVYKYYFAGVTPLALPLFASRKGALIFLCFNIGLMLLPREVTPWLAVLLLTFVPNLMSPEERNAGAVTSG